MWDMAIRPYSTIDDLSEKINSDIANSNHPTFIIYDGSKDNKDEYIKAIENLNELWKENKIWLHINLSHDGCFAILEEFQFLTDIDCDSLIIEASHHFEVSYESSLMWVKNRTRIQEGMDLSKQIQFQYLKSNEAYTVDFKNYQVYLGKMNRAYKFWFVFNMKGVDAVKQELRDKL
jgi:hypothetical protein